MLCELRCSADAWFESMHWKAQIQYGARVCEILRSTAQILYSSTRTQSGSSTYRSDARATEDSEAVRVFTRSSGQQQHTALSALRVYGVTDVSCSVACTRNERRGSFCDSFVLLCYLTVWLKEIGRPRASRTVEGARTRHQCPCCTLPTVH